ncbi:microsomal glutathione S-transferase 1-like [Cimex lectularius]|uniref:Microsomal glutathione S-transferase 1 n=1 Tax=Cimex lectularius TaxID=79782 RepID=A0A8I6R7T6_CIMLE|nr:microsomal glutathione S-transferase 1-like [Cimex lectularius]
MEDVGDLMTFDNPAFMFYVFSSAALVLKMLILTPLTARQRFKNKVFLSPEDTSLLKGSKVDVHPDVERVRRAHRNDLENVVFFLSMAFCYILTNPTKWVAILVLAAFTVARFLHTFFYLTAKTARMYAFAVGYLVLVYMAGTTVMHFS